MTTTLYLLPTREPPDGNRVKAPPWPPPPLGKIRTTKNQNKIHSEIETTMKKDRKKQEDRLLKHLSLRERQRQVQLRQQIAQDLSFLVV
jgi:hypothetical protein